MTAYAAELGAPRVRLRLTRRGRAVLAALAAAPVVAILALSLLNGVAATATSTPAPAPAIITVESGQSLWQIAQFVAPNHNPADVVSDLLAVNGLEGATVRPGQALIVPARYID
jgi:LysM repeat protein